MATEELFHVIRDDETGLYGVGSGENGLLFESSFTHLQAQVITALLNKDPDLTFDDVGDMVELFNPVNYAENANAMRESDGLSAPDVLIDEPVNSKPLADSHEAEYDRKLQDWREWLEREHPTPSMPALDTRDEQIEQLQEDIAALKADRQRVLERVVAFEEFVELAKSCIEYGEVILETGYPAQHNDYIVAERRFYNHTLARIMSYDLAKLALAARSLQDEPAPVNEDDAPFGKAE